MISVKVQTIEHRTRLTRKSSSVCWRHTAKAFIGIYIHLFQIRIKPRTSTRSRS